MANRIISYADALREGLSEMMQENENVFLLGEDIGVYGGSFGVTKGLIQEFGEERVRDTPISEAGIMGAAVGAAMMGMCPVMEIMFSDFITLTLDQLVNTAAKAHYMYGGQMNVPLVLRTASGSGTGAGSQHSQSLEAWLCHVPGLKVVMPSTPYDAKGLLKTAIADNNPVIFFEPKVLYKTTGEVPEEEYTIPFGKADIKKEGADLTIVTYGRMVPVSLEASLLAEQEGISVEVVDLRTLSPWDKETVFTSVEKTGRLLVTHEACKTGGFGGEIVSTIVESSLWNQLKSPILRICGEDIPIPFTPEYETNAIPTVDKIYQGILKIMKQEM